MANPYSTAAGSANLGLGGNGYGGSNPYLNQNIDASLSNVTRAYNNTIRPQQLGVQAASGSFGNSGQQQMQLEDQRNLGQTLANTDSTMRMADYTQQQSMYNADQANQLQGRIADQNFQLGQGNLGVAQQNAATNLQGVNNAYTLGQGTLALGNLQAQNSYNLGLGQNENQRYGIDQQSATSRYAADQGLEGARSSASASQAVGMANASNNYSLGMANNAYNYAGLDAQIANQNFQNQLAAANFGLTAYGQLGANNQTGVTAGTQIQNTPLNYQNQFANQANVAGGLGTTGTSAQTNQGNPYLSAIGGAMMGNQIQNPAPSAQKSNIPSWFY